MKQKKETHAQSHCERSVAIAQSSNRRAFTLAEGATHVGTCDNGRKSAFTLAEVLITLAIIGVVAAMTIPTLISDYQEKVTVTKVKKMYSTLANAYSMYVINNGEVSAEWTAEGAKTVFEAFKPYLKIGKECGISHEGCIIDTSYNWLRVDRSDLAYGITDRYYKVRLSDGAALIFRGKDAVTNGSIFYDINADTAPNRWGIDMFEFDIIGESIIPTGLSDSSETFDYSCTGDEARGYGCTAWVIHKGNLDYLRCYDLTWEDSKCSN